MTFELEDMTDVCVYTKRNGLTVKISNTGKNEVFLMKQLLEHFGFDLIFESLCKNELKILKAELDEKLKELEE